MKRESTTVAKILKEVSRRSVKVGANSRCVYLLHQPKMPSGVKNMK